MGFISLTTTSIKQTCKKLLELVSKSSTLQLHVELKATGFKIREWALYGGQRHAELLARLKNVRDSELFDFALLSLPF